ncbi:MAG: arginase, partial [Bacteroidota bacterium]
AGAGTRGASLGFAAMEIAGWKKGSDLFQRLTVIDIPDNNHELYEPDRNPYGHRIKAICEVFDRTARQLAEAFSASQFPIVIGGDHSVAAGTVSGIRKAYPDKRVGVIWIDAHADLHTPYTTPSGNLHGMPLGILLGIDNEHHRINNPVPETVEEWSKIKGIWGIQPKVLPSDLIYFGVRDTEIEEDAAIAEMEIRNFSVDEVRSRGIAEVVNETRDRLKECDLVYISFDVDSMDPEDVSNGTGTPVPHGFSPREAQLLMETMIERLPICCVEFVEINPTLDHQGNKMAETAFDLLEQVVMKVEKTYLR